jgi:hypothetical protein
MRIIRKFLTIISEVLSQKLPEIIILIFWSKDFREYSFKKSKKTKIVTDNVIYSTTTNKINAKIEKKFI